MSFPHAVMALERLYRTATKNQALIHTTFGQSRMPRPSKVEPSCGVLSIMVLFILYVECVLIRAISQPQLRHLDVLSPRTPKENRARRTEQLSHDADSTLWVATATKSV